MDSEMKISDEEASEISFAISTMVAAAELFMEGKKLNKKGENRLDAAMKVIDEYHVTNEEIGLYVKELQKSERRITTNFLRNEGVVP